MALRSNPIEATNFIESEINKDIEDGRVSECVQTRHPPEPSGYMHIGHVRNIVLNYGLAEKYNGICNLRYDDTNPSKESQEFVESIQEDVKWLGYHWNEIHYATEYFQQNYEVAVKLIKDGKAYVDDLSAEELSAYRGTLTQPGKNSPYRDRSVEENLDLFERMKNGEFEMGARCLRAKIDMASPNINMRDPVIYRIQYLHHQRIGNTWNIYPSYDFAHPIDDSIEGVTHSIAGPEFEDHIPLYNWVLENAGLRPVHRMVYSNLYVKGAILGKRFIKKLVLDGKVSGFDDPRLFTIRGLRRRGILAESLIDFVNAAGVSKANSVIDPAMLDYFVRNTLNTVSKRVMAVVDPIKLVITNLKEDEEIEINLADYPQKEETSHRKYYFGRNLLIERSDFEIVPPPKYHRFFVGNEVRLNGAYIVKCTGYETDENGVVTTVYGEYDPETRSGTACTKRVKGTIHWLNEKHAKNIEVRLFENLTIPKEESSVSGGKEQSATEDEINPNSLTVLNNCYIEDAVEYNMEDRYQFLRNGYFCLDKDSTDEKLVFNRTVGLKDSYKPAN